MGSGEGEALVNAAIRGKSGRFAAGGPGGPGRPKKAKGLRDATLFDLASPASGAELYLTATMLADREEWLASIEMDFPPSVVSRIKMLVAVSDLARSEIIRRLREVPV